MSVSALPRIPSTTASVAGMSEIRSATVLATAVVGNSIGDYIGDYDVGCNAGDAVGACVGRYYESA